MNTCRLLLRYSALAFVFLVFLSTNHAQISDKTRYVNPFIGTGGHGHTFPGATRPFGMVQLSPDTRIDNWDGSSGYHYSDDIIYGFSHTHLSGTGIPDGCDILFMPVKDGPIFFASSGENNGYASKFSHDNEHAEPGFYSVRLNDEDILAELTSTTRVGFHRYTFPKGNSRFASVMLDLRWRDKRLDSHISKIGNNTVEGYRRSSSWAKDQTIFFVAEFSEPFEARSSTTADDPATRELNSKALWGLTFDAKDEKTILIKVAISHVSIEGARKNLETELPHWDFDRVRAEAKEEWNKELGKIEVSGGTDEQTTNFYTALYHTMIHPNVFNDVDGKYRGHDGKVHQLWSGDTPVPMSAASARKEPLAGGTGDADKSVRAPSEQYTVFSLWDTFRAAHPLYTIIDERRTVDFINTFIRQYEQGGRLPVWELWGEETDTMIGYHAVSVIADAMAKGIQGFDYEKAYEAAKHSAELDHFGLAGYKKRGYISSEDENESVSRTLEYAYNDWCIAQMANVLLRLNAGSLPASLKPMQAGSLRSDVATYSRRARYFENLFDSKTGFFRPKKNGGFVEPFAPNEVTFGFTEGNSWQYSFFVPHDVSRLIDLMGGPKKFGEKLDELFTTDQKLAGREQADLTGLIGQYAHGNEPSHHITYLYNYVGQPWKTQKLVRRIMDEFYKNAPDGLIGNEDCGQMSAWYVLSASGFYPVNPGDGIYAFGTPLFPQMTYRLENGKTFTIRAPNVSSKNIYIGSAKFNGASYKKAFITHADLMKGGVLEFSMTDQPMTNAFSEFPVSKVEAETLPVPAVRFGELTSEGIEVFFDRVNPMDVIFYSTDGTDPFSSKTGIVSMGVPILKDSTSLKVVGYDPDRKVKSKIVDAVYRKKPNDWTVKVISGYSTQYTGGGDNAIVDGIRGTINFSSGEWQGVQGKPYEAVIDLQRETTISEVGGSFLQSARSWIWMPDRIEFELSNDGVNFARISDFKPGFPQTEMEPAVREFRRKIKPFPARYIRIKAYNFGKIPQWHLGAGGDPWIFIDEIIIN